MNEVLNILFLIILCLQAILFALLAIFEYGEWREARKLNKNAELIARQRELWLEEIRKRK